MPPTYYEVLQISPTATANEIEQAYEARYDYFRRLVTHHDPEMANRANQALLWLERIRITLIDPTKREAYDTSIGLTGPVGGLADLEARPVAITSSQIAPPRAKRSPVQPEPESLERMDAWVCPQCRKANAVGTQFCTRCGQQIGTTCVKCGAPIQVDATFCAVCGVNIGEAKREIEMEEAERIRREREQAHRHEEEEARQKVEAEKNSRASLGIVITGAVVGAIAAWIAWHAIWPSIMSNTLCTIGQLVLGAIGGGLTSGFIAEKVSSWGEGAAFIVGVLLAVVGGILAFPIIVLGLIAEIGRG